MQPTCALRMCDISTPDANDDCIADKTPMHTVHLRLLHQVQRIMCHEELDTKQNIEHSRGSGKWNYMAQVLSEIIGNGGTYELFQYVYDLWLWTTVGAAKNSTKISLRLALAGRPFTPDYWRVRHAAHRLTCSDSSVTPLSFSRSHHTSGRCLITSGCKMKPKKRCGPNCTYQDQRHHMRHILWYKLSLASYVACPTNGEKNVFCEDLKVNAK